MEGRGVWKGDGKRGGEYGRVREKEGYGRGYAMGQEEGRYGGDAGLGL